MLQLQLEPTKFVAESLVICSCVVATVTCRCMFEALTGSNLGRRGLWHCLSTRSANQTRSEIAGTSEALQKTYVLTEYTADTFYH
jgi:hypothetical protein